MIADQHGLTCKSCGKTFPTKYNCRRHFKAVHEKLKDAERPSKAPRKRNQQETEALLKPPPCKKGKKSFEKPPPSSARRKTCTRLSKNKGEWPPLVLRRSSRIKLSAGDKDLPMLFQRCKKTPADAVKRCRGRKQTSAEDIQELPAEAQVSLSGIRKRTTMQSKQETPCPPPACKKGGKRPAPPSKSVEKCLKKNKSPAPKAEIAAPVRRSRRLIKAQPYGQLAFAAIHKPPEVSPITKRPYGGSIEFSNPCFPLYARLFSEERRVTDVPTVKPVFACDDKQCKYYEITFACASSLSLHKAALHVKKGVELISNIAPTLSCRGSETVDEEHPRMDLFAALGLIPKKDI
ncbi:Hypothetical predicted protein [Cloeon dipterum]|uniref:C2H2-type domain-containing protein n=1 Tax=Cloeon dipterum TaxID=197152 RepID=A0A8S1DY87_9INSE|nr:Hypothetical predicted protein [Cloeon dipterum]